MKKDDIDKKTNTGKKKSSMLNILIGVLVALVIEVTPKSWTVISKILLELKSVLYRTQSF